MKAFKPFLIILMVSALTMDCFGSAIGFISVDAVILPEPVKYRVSNLQYPTVPYKAMWSYLWHYIVPSAVTTSAGIAFTAISMSASMNPGMIGR